MIDPRDSLDRFRESREARRGRSAGLSSLVLGGVLRALSEWPPWQKNDEQGAQQRGTDPVSDQVTPQVTPQVVRLLRAGTGEHPRRKLQALEHAALDMARRRGRLELRLE
mgnify:CR=1 FL=1